MMSVASNLGGAIVEVYYYSHFDVGTTNTLIGRGEVRAVTTMTDDNSILLWIEELDEAESACWFGEREAPAVWGDSWYGGNGLLAADTATSKSRPGLVRALPIYYGEYDSTRSVVIRKPADGSFRGHNHR